MPIFDFCLLDEWDDCDDEDEDVENESSPTELKSKYCRNFLII